jgi:nucleoside phosphorylase
MGLLDWLLKPKIPKLKIDSSLSSNSTYNYLVVSALQEELIAFTDLTSKLQRTQKFRTGAVEYNYKKSQKQNVKLLTFTSNKMGMSYNAAAIMRIIVTHHPLYTFFIGTCAGLGKDEQQPGDVLVPQFVYNYESGKYKDDGTFHPDHVCFETDEEVRKYAESIKRKVDKNYSVFTDENFCTGSAVIDNAEKRKSIVDKIPRKVTGLDMEAFSLACINNILREEGKRVSVIKGIMDFGEDKSASEKKANKEKAKINSAKFTLALIDYIEDNILSSGEIIIS